MSEKLRVVIIGAGASGLAAIKCCLDEEIVPTCYEKSDGVGGLWRFTEKPEPGRAGVYKTTTINSSKELLAYSTFPPPSDFPNFMHHTKLYEYMKLYAEEYKLYDYIKYNSTVINVEKDESFEKTSKWKVTVISNTKENNNREEDTEVTEIFDAVMICSGHHAFPNNPASNIPGFHRYRGNVLHGHDYRDHKPFEDRKVMVVGLGNTGGDLAAELSRHAKKTYLSTRRGAWVINRIAHRGLPYDTEVVTRFVSMLQSKILPTRLLNWAFEKRMNERFDHELYGLKPEHRIMSQHPLINDELPNRIANGTVTVVPDVSKFYESGVMTSDGVYHEVDDVIFATGYVIKFPFLSDDIMKVDSDNCLSPLYKHVFPISLSSHPTLAFIGNVQPLGGLMPIAEMQSRWATRVFKGDTKLPSTTVMESEAMSRSKNIKTRYVSSKRHTIQVDYVTYMDTIAEEIGVKPNLIKLLLTDPILAVKMYFGPACSYQFRVQGPGQWTGARKAIDNTWDRIYAGYGHKSMQIQSKGKVTTISKEYEPETHSLILTTDKFSKSLLSQKIMNFVVLALMLLPALLLIIQF